MKNFTIFSLLFLFAVLSVRGQQRRDGLKQLRLSLLSADSVLLISHEATAGITIVDSVTNKELPLPQLLLNGKLNKKIVLERRLLEPTEIKSLSDIITRPFEDKLVSSAKCFIPHHAILIYRKKKVSYIDICFSCHRFTTKNLPDIGYFDQRKWKELHSFFRQNKMKYELEEEEEQEVEK